MPQVLQPRFPQPIEQLLRPFAKLQHAALHLVPVGGRGVGAGVVQDGEQLPDLAQDRLETKENFGRNRHRGDVTKRSRIAAVSDWTRDDILIPNGSIESAGEAGRTISID